MREPTVLLHDLTRGLLWPRLLRLPALALRPERLLTALAAIVAIGLIGEINRAWNEEASFNQIVEMSVVSPVRHLASGTLAVNPSGVSHAARRLLAAPLDMLIADPWALFFLGIPMLIVWGVAGAAISRSAACEVALGRVVAWPEGLAFGVRRWVNCLGAIVAPIAFVAVVHLVIAAGGAALLTWPIGNIAGAVLYGLALVAAVVAVLVGVGYLLGWSMLVPAIACEGTDALDAIQRVYAYVTGRPLRLLVYLFVTLAVGALSFGVLAFIAQRGIDLASAASVQWSGERGARVLGPEGELGGIDGAARSIVGFWNGVVHLLVAAYAVSFVHTAGTLVYLICRRINDGQEIAELWTPDAR